MSIENVKSEAELQKVLESSKGPVVLDFYQQGCPPCEEDAPKVDELAQRRPDVTVVRVDVNEATELADAYKVEGTPTYFVAKSGEKLGCCKKEVPGADGIEKALKKMK